MLPKQRILTEAKSKLKSVRHKLTDLAEQNTGLLVLCRKELADHLNSKRFVIIVILVALTGLASIYAAANGIRAATQDQKTDFVFLYLFTAGGKSVPPFISFIALLGPLVSLALSFDAICGERSRRTLSKLLAQPIYRDAVINGKFLAVVIVSALMLVSLGALVGGLGLLLTGIPPSAEELVRILAFLFLTTVYMALWSALAIFFSVCFRQAATSALAGMAVWLFFSVFAQLLVGLVADAIFPLTDQAAAQIVFRNQQLRQFLGWLSPTTLYSEAVIAILNPSIRILGPVMMEQIEGAIAGPLPLGQSLLLIWPHFTGLIAGALLCFAGSYVLFMRQEIRAD
ncbi:MAG: ABC transporter permease [Firmicutes bacterium]|nr:ABC transporter permease [Bacillota bacterium]